MPPGLPEPKSLLPGSLHYVRILLPGEILGSGELCLELRSLWSRRDFDSECFITEFVIIDSEQYSTIIQVLIDQFALK
jgi:hypothetical protein